MGTELRKPNAYEISIKKVYSGDVVVAGGGMAGVSAALAAADAGADVILAERYGFLGGTATASAVAGFQAGPDVEGKPVIRGIYEEIRSRMRALGDMEIGHRFDPETLKLVLFDLCAERGVRLLLHVFLCDARVHSDGRIKSALIATKMGHCQVEGDVFIDATGDGDLAAFAGAEVEYGRGEDGKVQPMTLQFQICGFDQEKIKKADYKSLWPEFAEETGVTTSRGKIMPTKAGGGSKLAFNMAHVNGYNALDAEDMAKAEHSGRQQAMAILQFFRRRVPGCEKVVFASTAAQIGVRETRRIRGDYEMTRADVLEARHFDDAVGRSTSWIDIHSPLGEGVLHEYLPEDQWFEIPYRALLPRGLKNLYVVGRCMSGTHEALGALREMPTCSLTGEAAGIAASLCIQNNCETRELDLATLQDELQKHGVSLVRQQ